MLAVRSFSANELTGNRIEENPAIAIRQEAGQHLGQQYLHPAMSQFGRGYTARWL
ncbi:hypothetical protein [Candidatus Amarolinea dominans]|uniref:hypothetical protein n=1 Tax=Candidatus Amarolinea dominans TaxID=3140696 RepID=UPI003134EE48|nr:hypothetical protein [Anaerolineae bacterium]